VGDFEQKRRLTFEVAAHGQRLFRGRGRALEFVHGIFLLGRSRASTNRLRVERVHRVSNDAVSGETPGLDNQSVAEESFEARGLHV
jgi:hypothetical protein